MKSINALAIFPLYGLYFVTTQAQQCRDLSQWCHVGDITKADEFDPHRLSAYQALFIPYFDKKLVGKLLMG